MFRNIYLKIVNGNTTFSFTYMMVKTEQININPILATGLFLYPLKTSEHLWLLMLSGDTERDQWREKG